MEIGISIRDFITVYLNYNRALLHNKNWDLFPKYLIKQTSNFHDVIWFIDVIPDIMCGVRVLFSIPWYTM